MSKFFIERGPPRDVYITPKESQAISHTFYKANSQLSKSCYWVQSLAIKSKIYCIPIAAGKWRRSGAFRDGAFITSQ